MANRRSEEAYQRRRRYYQIRVISKKVIMDNSYRDYELAETVCKTNRDEIMNTLTVSHPELVEGMSPSAIHKVMKGLILSDSRGRGSFQK